MKDKSLFEIKRVPKRKLSPAEMNDKPLKEPIEYAKYKFSKSII